MMMMTVMTMMLLDDDDDDDDDDDGEWLYSNVKRHHLTLSRISRTCRKLTSSDGQFILSFQFISSTGALELDSILRHLRN